MLGNGKLAAALQNKSPCDRAEAQGDWKASTARTMTKDLFDAVLTRGLTAQNTKVAASGDSGVGWVLMGGFGSRGAHTQPQGTDWNWIGGKEGEGDPASRGSRSKDRVAE